MSYNIPSGSQILAPSVKLSSPGGGSSVMSAHASQLSDLSFFLPNTYGTAGHAMVIDGLGQFSFADLIDAQVNSASIATDASASNGNVMMGLQAGLRQKLFGNGNYSVATNDQNIISFDASTQQLDLGNASYSTKNDTYTTQCQIVLGASAGTNAWRITNSAKTNDYLNLNVTAGVEEFILGSSSTPVMTRIYGDARILKDANQRAAKLYLGAGTEVVRVGGNLKSLATVPPNIIINNGAESPLISETVGASFLDEAGTQIRFKYGFRDITTVNNCHFKLRVKWGSNIVIDDTIQVTTDNAYMQGEITVFIQTNGANPTRNLTAYANSTRVTNQPNVSCTRNSLAAQDFTTSQPLSLVLVGTQHSGDAIELEHASIDVVFPETMSP